MLRPFNTDPAVPGRGVGSTLERGPNCYEEHRSVGPAVLSGGKKYTKFRGAWFR